jgi:pimeloyl-ACP methyl ester carboxylesterase
VNFIHQRAPGEKVAVIGVSMGAAAALLADPPLPVAGMVLESCYPTIYQAAEDRMVDRFGFPLGEMVTPLLAFQIPLRLGVGLDDLQPIQRARAIATPKFFIAGSTDRLTTARESEEIFKEASAPKQFWLVPGASHVDMLGFAGAEYERRVMSFLCSCLDRTRQRNQ